MPVKTIFTDDNNNEMDFYINDKGKLFISVGAAGEDINYSGFITLDKEDVNLLIKKLVDIEKEMDA
jgi:hypothetical protein